MQAGSSGFVWHLTEPGHRLLHPSSGRQRQAEPSVTFLSHTLAVTEARLVIQQTIAQGGGELVVLRTEPACWRSWLRPSGGTRWLKPDLEVITRAADGQEDHWLIEVDLGTENPARLLATCHRYQDHLHSGIEQAALGYYPQVLWLCNQPRRATWLSERIASDPGLLNELFVVVGSREEVERVVRGKGVRSSMPTCDLLGAR